MKENTEESPVLRVTWFEHKIHVVCHESNQVHVFSDEKPFKDLTGERISVVEMQQPRDISACKVSRSLFISDRGSRCLWRVHMKNGEINQWKIHGMPNTLSINPSGELIVVVRRNNRYHLDTFSCLEVNQTQSITLLSFRVQFGKIGLL